MSDKLLDSLKSKLIQWLEDKIKENDEEEAFTDNRIERARYWGKYLAL